MTKKSGWNGESYRHEMAAKGIKTKEYNTLFKEYKKINTDKEKIEQLKWYTNLFLEDKNDIINTLESGSGGHVTIVVNYKDIYEYFDKNNDYEVTKIKKIPHFEIKNFSDIIPTPFIVHKFFIKSKINNNIIYITDYPYFNSEW